MREATQAHRVSVHILSLMSETRGQQPPIFMIFCPLRRTAGSSHVRRGQMEVYVPVLNISHFSRKAL